MKNASMKFLSLMATVAFAGLMGVSAQAVAGDSTTQDKAAAMKTCMERQKSTNSSMSQDQMEMVCANESKDQKDKSGNDLATAPQQPKPKN